MKQLWERVLHIALISMVCEALDELVGDAEPLVKLADEQEAAFITEVSATEVSLKFAVP